MLTKMLLPESVKPKNSIYYNGAYLIEILNERRQLNYLELFKLVNERKKMSMAVFTLCLDWLYLIDVAIVKFDGEVELCI